MPALSRVRCQSNGRTLLGIEVSDLGLETADNSLAGKRAGERRFADATFLRDECDDVVMDNRS